jgi:ABC-2 type transport system permease protein
MKAFLTLTWTESKLFLREPAASFFTLAFPLLLLFAFGAIFGNDPASAPGAVGYATYALPGYVALTVGSLALLSLPITLATQRDQGILRRFRVTPLRPATVLGTQALVNLLMLFAGTGLLLAAATLTYNVPLPDAPLVTVGALLFAGLTFFALGFLLGALVPTARAAQSIGMGLFFPMLFLSGAAIPQFLFPDWLTTASLALPLTHATRLLQDAWLHGQWNAPAALVLLATGVASTVVAARVFRWT